MDIKQLRIGNYINYNYLGTSIVSVIESGDDITEADSNQYTPIELTEEWLLKFGFKWSHFHPDTAQREYYTYKDFGIELYNNRYYKYNIEIKTIHQLQNLYFALIRQELTIK